MARRDNGTGTFYQRPNGSWAGRIYMRRGADGKPKYKCFSGKNQAEVKRKIKEFNQGGCITDSTKVSEGDVREDDGNYSFVPVAAIKGTIPAFGDIQSPELAEDLAKLKDKLTAVTETPVTVGGNGKKGIAEFRNLSFGLYLVAQKTAASGYKMTASFLVSVPYLEDGAYVYNVKADPKTDLEREVVPAPTEKPSTPSGGGKLPQTGQLWWPVPVLICMGLGCIAVGLIRRREGSE